MLKFDKLKIVSDIENIEILKQNDFDEIVKNNYTVALKFYMTYPFHIIRLRGVENVAPYNIISRN